MTAEQLPWIAIGVLIIASLYSSVGHAGASGYIAVMSLFGISPVLIKPTALILNIFVASISAWQFWRMGFLSWKLFLPLAACSIPMAFVGGYLNLPTPVFKFVLGLTLLFAAIRFLSKPSEERVLSEPILPITLSIGGGIGLLSGLTGTGGGIFLTPLLISMHWASAKTAAAVSALFILVNSVSGLLGNLSATQQVPPLAGILLVAALIGGSIGSYLGSHRFSNNVIQRLLSLVLILAGLKLLLT